VIFAATAEEISTHLAIGIRGGLEVDVSSAAVAVPPAVVVGWAGSAGAVPAVARSASDVAGGAGGEVVVGRVGAVVAGLVGAVTVPVVREAAGVESAACPPL